MAAALAFLLWTFAIIVLLAAAAVALVLVVIAIASKRALAEVRREADEKRARREARDARLTAVRSAR